MIGAGGLAIIAMLVMLNQNPSASVQDFSTVPSQVNYPAPDLSLHDLSGQVVSLIDYRGSVVLVNLWATWCPPCREEMPALQEFYNRYQNSGFVLIGINQEEPKELVQKFVNEFNLSFPVWLDETYQAEQKFKTMNLPSSYVIDREGMVRLLWVGGISMDNLEKYVPDIIMEN